MVTMRTQMTVKTSSARTPPITAYGTALVVSTTALGSEGEEKNREKKKCNRHEQLQWHVGGERDIWEDKCKKRERRETLKVQSMSRVGDKIGEKERERGGLEFHRAERTQEVCREESEAGFSIITFHQSNCENIR